MSQMYKVRIKKNDSCWTRSADVFKTTWNELSKESGSTVRQSKKKKVAPIPFQIMVINENGEIVPA